MLIAAIFAAGLFNIDSSAESSVSLPSQDHQEVFSAWRIFLVTCLCSTFIILALWTLWCRCGQQWVDKWIKSSLESRLSGPSQVPEEQLLRQRQRDASVAATLCLVPSEDTMKYSIGGGSSCSDGYCKHSLQCRTPRRSRR
jgi:hypothetical protein